MTVHQKLADLRKRKGLSQLQLAETLHVSRQAISRWETGAAMPSTDNLKYLSELYGVSIEYLLDDTADGLPQAAQENTSETKTARKEPPSIDAKKAAVFAGIIALILAVALICTIVPHGDEERQITPISELEAEDNRQNSSQNEFDIVWGDEDRQAIPIGEANVEEQNADDDYITFTIE